MSQDQIVQMLAEKQAIQELMARYAERIDAGDAKGAADCYAENGIGVYWGEYVGRKAIAERLAGILKDFSATSHHLTNVQIKLNGDRATAMAYVYAFHRVLPEQRQMHYWGRWVDELVKINGEWLFARREVVGVGSIGVPPNGAPNGDLVHPGHPGRMI